MGASGAHLITAAKTPNGPQPNRNNIRDARLVGLWLDKHELRVKEQVKRGGIYGRAFSLVEMN